ncbi:phosphate propanoyltransferase [Lysinibacillus sp. FSL K6-0232]|uniref:phosphate propanoyltransferase n=1 Tax=unclassified Lysinibacillus TaxID=2636778 RepID=UPI0030FAB658
MQHNPIAIADKIPIAVSARHCHVSEEDFHYLFGTQAVCTKWKDLSQPGQFAAEQVITIQGPRGCIDKVRILGPFREQTQVEVSQTDAVKLGVTPPIRMSGDVQNSAPITLIGPEGTIQKQQGLIIAQAHIHMSEMDAQALCVQDQEIVKVEIINDVRQLQIMNVVVRVSPDFVLEMHVDTDEANAASVVPNQYGRLIKME